MKRTFVTLSSIIVLAIAAFATTSQAQSNSEQLSKQQLASLTATAKTPAEHSRLAAYYSAQANADLAQSKEHAQMAEQFKKNSVTNSQKFAAGTVNHCEYLAQNLNQSAAQKLELSKEHAQMATEAGKK